MTAPAPDPLTKGDWHKILRNARAVQAGDPDYAEAQEVIAQAMEELPRLDAIANAADKRPTVGDKVAATGLGLSQAATFGFGDEIGELLFPGTKESGRMAMDKAPGYAMAGDVVGSLAVPIPGVGVAAKGITKGVGSVLGRTGLREAMRTGAKVGAVSGGLGAAGRSEGDIGDRAVAGGFGAGVGGVVGGALPLAAEGVKQAVMHTPIVGPTLRAVAAKLRGPKAVEGTAQPGRNVMADALPEHDIPTYLRRPQPSAPVAPQVDEEAALRAALGKAGVKPGPAMDETVNTQLGRAKEIIQDVAPDPARPLIGHPFEGLGGRGYVGADDFANIPPRTPPTPEQLAEIRAAQQAARPKRPRKPKAAPVEEVRVSPEEAANRARAAARVEQEIASGVRGPGGSVRWSKGSGPPSKAQGNPLNTSKQSLKEQIENALQMGQTMEQVAEALQYRGVTPDEIIEAMSGRAGTAGRSLP